MDGTKPWYMSKTMWTDVLTVVTGLLVSAHVVSVDQSHIIIDMGPALAVGLVTFVLGFAGMYGRITATKKVVM